MAKITEPGFAVLERSAVISAPGDTSRKTSGPIYKGIATTSAAESRNDVLFARERANERTSETERSVVGALIRKFSNPLNKGGDS